MEGRANITIGQVNNEEKQKLTLTYTISPIDSIEETQKIKYAVDAVAVIFGADVSQEARIIGQEDDNAAKKEGQETAEEAAKE